MLQPPVLIGDYGMKAVFQRIRSVASTRTTVILTGETGTGKGVIARMIHQKSNRAGGPFVSVHCGAIPDNLLESELFGHERGAFTGAVRQKKGKFELASGGTIFLDEVGTISMAMQVKLLKVLQERTIQRVGGESDITVDVRIIAATNEDLNQRRLDGTLRSDLYFRLNVFPIELPPLRERLEAVKNLSHNILERLDQYYLKGITEIDPVVITAFENYSWPGNIRELENLMERAYILETSDILSAESFPRELFQTDLIIMPAIEIDSSKTLAEIRMEAVDQAQRQYLKEILTLKKGRIKESATIAGITPRQLHKLMSRYGLKKEEFKERGVIGTKNSDNLKRN